MGEKYQEQLIKSAKKLTAGAKGSSMVTKESIAALQALAVVRDLPSPLREEMFVAELIKNLRESGTWFVNAEDRFDSAA